MKKELYIPLIILALTLVFGAICLMVYLSDGNAYWIKKKLKIGALLLTFTWVTSSCDKPPIVTCYDPMPPKNSIRIDNHGDSLIYSINDTMFVQILNPTYNYFSYDILNELEVSLKSGILQKQNDSLNYNNFHYLILTNEFEPGNYKINFFGEADTIVTKKNKIKSYDFQIK